MKKLVIDVRMINSSGIGTYLQNVIPFLKDKFELILLGNVAELKAFQFDKYAHIIEFEAPIFSIQELFKLPLVIPKCDIFWTPHYNVPLFPIRAKNRVVTLHDAYYFAFYDTLKPIQKLFIRLASKVSVKFSSHIFTVSQFSKSELIKYLNCDSSKMSVVYNGVAEDYQKEFKLKEISDSYILYVGNVKPHKNLYNALNAFKILLIKYPSLKFYIVGKKEGFITGDESLQKVIASCAESVLFTGRVALEELKNYYANSDVFLFPSLYEGFGIPILEAMKFNIPIVSSSAASLQEVGGDAVLYCNPHDIKDIAHKVEMVLDKHWYPDVNRYNNQLEKFTWEKVAESHIRILNGI